MGHNRGAMTHAAVRRFGVLHQRGEQMNCFKPQVSQTGKASKNSRGLFLYKLVCIQVAKEVS
jgi:hypothetical protein